MHTRMTEQAEAIACAGVRMKSYVFLIAMIAGASLQATAQISHATPAIDETELGEASDRSSAYVPMDSWIYPAMDRLHGLGYVDSAYLGLRPWTRLSIAHMLKMSADDIETKTGNDEAGRIFTALMREFQPDLDGCELRPKFGVDPRQPRPGLLGGGSTARHPPRVPGDERRRLRSSPPTPRSRSHRRRSPRAPPPTK